MASARSDPVAEGLDLLSREDGDAGRVDTAFAGRDLVSGWNPLSNGRLALPEAPGLGIELDEAAISAHPYRPLAFPSLWDTTWRDEFTGTARLAPVR